ncbi:putative guanine deaminase [Aspergillus bombycis]|uniref:Putative guanine deaminase n=1 Tax=Aspergillus bombycis TaxID=109264 RepID=A0A1F8A376_9EURO|nr:putative guanine deaminase [Aspergillus bombycis]OGM46176.1 putative guanine deaminase [Aspergillus bombycis]
MPDSYILIKGATVISMEASGREVLDNCDVLLEDEWIKAVGRDISLPTEENAITIDAENCIITPGFVDGHHHMWQHLLRGITVDWSLFGYCCHLRAVYGSLYEPDDVYCANYAAALSLLNNGVTTVLDHSHIMNSPEHADAAVRGLKDAAIRGTFCYGFYQNPTVPGDLASMATDAFDKAARLQDALRVRQEHFPNNDPNSSLLTFGIALDEAPMQSREQNIGGLEIARELGARLSTVHTSVLSPGGPKAEVIEQFADANLMGPDLVFSHGGWMTDSELAAVRSSGAGIVGTPDTELQMGMGYPVVWKASDLGCRTCLGLDITSNQGNDFMAQMRLALQTQRAREYAHTVHREVDRKTADVLRMATLGGAEVMQMESLIGSIVPGKKADLVIFRCDDIDTVPVMDPIGTVVFHASSKNIDTVIVNGRIVKQDGHLVGVDWQSLRGEIISRSQRLRNQAAKVDMEKPESEFRSVFESAMIE